MSAIRIGDVLRVQFPAQRPPGHEQVGTRPAVVVGIPEQVGSPRYPGLIMVPFTTSASDYAANSPALYPQFLAGQGGLPLDSVALCDHVRSLGVSRILARLGSLSPEEYAPVEAALQGMLRR